MVLLMRRLSIRRGNGNIVIGLARADNDAGRQRSSLKSSGELWLDGGMMEEFNIYNQAQTESLSALQPPGEAKNELKEKCIIYCRFKAPTLEKRAHREGLAGMRLLLKFPTCKQKFQIFNGGKFQPHSPR